MSQFSLICAIEAGRLEAQTLLMLTTLKRFGGTFAQSPIVAFQGRSGEQVSATTRKALAQMDVDYVYRPDLNKASWFNYTNKIAAVCFAEEAFDTPWRVWLDSDILCLDPPSFLSDPALEEVDFHARFEYMAPAVTNTNDSYAPYWAEVCALNGCDFDQISFHDLDLPCQRMKPFFNSGLFLWRPNTDFAATYARCYYRLLRARIAPHDIGPWFADQISLTPTIETLRLRWSQMAAKDHLMLFPGALRRPEFHDALKDANLVHYSRSRRPPYRAVFDPLLRARRPELEDLFATHDAHVPQSPAPGLRRTLRRMRQALYVRLCREI